MKRLLSMILALSLALSMAACGGSPAQSAPVPEPEAPASETASVSDVPEVTPEPTPAEPEESAVEEAEEKPEITDTVDAGSVIVGVKTIGFIDADGAKQKAIAVEYNTKIDGSTVALEDYEIENYSILHGTLQEGAAVSQEPGVPIRVYVNDVPETAEEGLDAGNFVIIEVGTDYLLSNVPQYEAAMIAGVKQVGEVTGETAIVLPGSDFVRNYAEGEDDGGPFGGPMDFGGPDGGFFISY